MVVENSEEYENAIVALLRLKRNKPEEIDTGKLNKWQRELEDVYGITGVELAEEYEI